VECSPSVCMAGEKCGNQCFEKRQYPPLVPYRTETRGWGLKTLADICKGKHFG
jgi:histone-lysine N-methyltransferase NSD2